MTRRLRIASMVAALLLLATGCGDDSVDNSDSPSAGNETDVGARPGSEDTEPDTEQAEGANQPEGTNQETDTDETDGETDAESGATSPEESAGTGERGTSDTPPGAEPRSGPEQTIDFPPPGANHVWPDNSVELEATASSGLPVEYRIEDDTGVCILEGNTLRVEQLGGCEVVASQSGNDEFDPAPEVARPFYVGAQTLNVQLEGLPESASASETVTFDVVVEGTVSDS
jgi:hypothetical protein